MRGVSQPRLKTIYGFTYGEYQVDQHVHHHEADQDPVHPLGQLGLGQFDREEDGDNCRGK